MGDRIRVYALSTCPYCRKTKRFLKEQGVEHDVVDVDLLEDEERERALDEVERLTGKNAFPVVVVGPDIIVGHDEARLRKALGL
jgi:glutaredoxin-like protein NrdH